MSHDELKNFYHGAGFNIVEFAVNKVPIGPDVAGKPVCAPHRDITPKELETARWGIRMCSDRPQNYIFFDWDHGEMPADLEVVVSTHRLKHAGTDKEQYSYHGVICVEDADGQWCGKFVTTHGVDGLELFHKTRNLVLVGEYMDDTKNPDSSVSTWEWVGEKREIISLTKADLEKLIPAKRAGGTATGGNVRVGERHTTALKHACCLLRSKKETDKTIQGTMDKWNADLNEPLPADEFDQIVADAISYCQNASEEGGHDEKEPDEKQRLMNFMRGKILKTVKSANDPAKIYCLVDSGDTRQAMELESSGVAEWLAATYYNETDSILSEDLYRLIPKLIKSMAKISKISSENVYIRTALVDGVLYYDLCNDSWDLVRVATDSIKIVKHGEDTPMFQRSPNQEAQVTPVLGSDPEHIERICKVLRINTLLFKVHLISFFIESIPVPIIVLRGEQGSSKSTQSSQIKRVVDPTGSTLEDNLSTLQNKVEDIYIHFANNYVIVFDNTGAIKNYQSDVLCRGVTGGTYACRKLYTNSQESIMKFKRKIVLNGIDLNIERGDLMERSVIYQTGAIPSNQRKTAAYLEAEFKSGLPEFLGAVFGVLQKAMGIKGSGEVSLSDLSRMADFEVWGECISQAMGHPHGAFLTEYRQSMQDSNYQLIEGNMLVSFFSEKVMDGKEYVITASNCYAGIKEYANEKGYDVKSRDFPKAANQLRGYITQHKPLLKEAGYDIEMQKNTCNNDYPKNATLITVRKTSSPILPPSVTGGEDGENALGKPSGGEISGDPPAG